MNGKLKFRLQKMKRKKPSWKLRELLRNNRELKKKPREKLLKKKLRD
jgi:hypothetical protein